VLLGLKKDQITGIPEPVPLAVEPPEFWKCLEPKPITVRFFEIGKPLTLRSEVHELSYKRESQKNFPNSKLIYQKLVLA